MKIAIIIPIHQLSGDRLTAFHLQRRTLKKQGIETVVVEHYLSSGEISPVEATHCWFAQAPGFWKSALLNLAAINHQADYLWFLDADIIGRFDAVLRSIEHIDADLIQPFDSIVNLTAFETAGFAQTRRFSIAKGEMRLIKPGPGPFSMIFRRDFFMRIGGFDERFIGYGWEDIELCRRAVRRGARTVTLQQPALHLYHERSSVLGRNNRLYGHLKCGLHVGAGDTVAALAHNLRLDLLAKGLNKGICCCRRRRDALNERFAYSRNHLCKVLSRLLPAPPISRIIYPDQAPI